MDSSSDRTCRACGRIFSPQPLEYEASDLGRESINYGTTVGEKGKEEEEKKRKEKKEKKRKRKKSESCILIFAGCALATTLTLSRLTRLLH